MMRKFLVCLLVSVFTISIIRAQQITRFAYIQTENKQPFYVKWNSKVWSSSSSGYLILSKIKDQQINVVVGFPKNIYPEQSFTISFNGNKDAGYLLKEFGEKGWGLYNLQSFAVTYAVKDASAPKEEVVPASAVNQPKAEEAKSPFGDLLVQVTQDTTVKNIVVEKPQPPPVVKKEEPVKLKIDSGQKVGKQEAKPVIKESPVTNSTEVKTTPNDVVNKGSADSTKTEAKIPDDKSKAETKPREKVVVKTETKPVDSVKNEIKNEVKQVAQETGIKTLPVAEEVKSSVNLFATNENAESYDYIYVIENKTGAKDTIGISIKKDKVEIKPVAKTEPGVKDTVIKTPPKNEPKFIEIIVDTAKKVKETPVIEPIKKDTVENIAGSQIKEPVKELIKDDKSLAESKKIETPATQPVKEGTKVVMVNTDCKNMATEKDFMALRKKMVAEDNDDDMVAAARKVFKTKCFTTDQVKNLCVLFLKDEGKYKFLDAAYPYVYDTDNFKQLSSLLTDEYYINRFKAMIKN
ncbi:MAG: DUF4476 domain-containing protein [Sphingobacteriales bacterium]|nr:MAG: DUF4476 domain-containing protein [Sphingobacteriales bacterium]